MENYIGPPESDDRVFLNLESQKDAGLSAKIVREECLEHLKTLNLTTKSSAEEVRRVAISTRRKFQEGGIDAKTFCCHGGGARFCWGDVLTYPHLHNFMEIGYLYGEPG